MTTGAPSESVTRRTVGAAANGAVDTVRATPPLEQALVVRAIRAERGHGLGVLVGAALAALHRAVAAGEHDQHPARGTAPAVERAIRAVGRGGMPPDTAFVGTPVARLGAVGGHGGAWRAIGVSPGRGRDLLARQAHAVDWPLWRTLRDAALDGLDIQHEAPPVPDDPPAPRGCRRETQLELELPLLDPTRAASPPTRRTQNDVHV